MAGPEVASGTVDGSLPQPAAANNIADNTTQRARWALDLPCFKTPSSATTGCRRSTGILQLVYVVGTRLVSLGLILELPEDVRWKKPHLSLRELELYERSERYIGKRRGMRVFRGKLYGVGVVVLVLGVVSVFTANPVAAEDIASIYREGSRLLKEDDYAGALRLFEQARDLDPGSSRIWLKIGLARAGLDDNQGAMEAYHRTVELDPTNFRPLYPLNRVDQNPVEKEF